MDPIAEDLRLYGSVSSVEPLEWAWVRAQLEAAGTYWVVATSPTHPHPRPVWGVWLDDALHLSIGSRVLVHALAVDPTATVHLDSGTDVVIVEGLASQTTKDLLPACLNAYDAKYDWDYDVEQYGPFTTVTPSTVLAWRSAGWAGRESFRQVGRWRFP